MILYTNGERDSKTPLRMVHADMRRDADPKKVEQVQGGEPVPPTTSASALEKADRILAKIKSKLRGDLSVEYTVNQLIQEARDMDNLARIFVGWQPWY